MPRGFFTLQTGYCPPRFYEPGLNGYRKEVTLFGSETLFNLAAGTPLVAVLLFGGFAGLVYVVREPFASRQSRTSIAAGVIARGGRLTLESQMPSGGVIFSDGVEADALDFNSGARAHIRAAAQKTHLVA